MKRLNELLNISVSSQFELVASDCIRENVGMNNW